MRVAMQAPAAPELEEIQSASASPPRVQDWVTAHLVGVEPLEFRGLVESLRLSPQFEPLADL